MSQAPGDQRFERLVERYQQDVLRTCFLYLRDKTLAEDAYPDGLILQRRLPEPVRLKQLPLNDRLAEADDRCYAYEYVTVWGYRLTEPERLLRIWGGE